MVTIPIFQGRNDPHGIRPGIIYGFTVFINAGIVVESLCETGQGRRRTVHGEHDLHIGQGGHVDRFGRLCHTVDLVLDGQCARKADVDMGIGQGCGLPHRVQGHIG
ncbi:hypothetical protein SDC9_173600 [bioreactor metagenome]|uniref:Uncharacterized protein n=1 Tax=bioreactor metagenome TaxID=1076179 RepID=A0A645GIW5_9ZZZZ